MIGAMRTTEFDATDAALGAGLRAVNVATLPAFDPAHTPAGRVWFLAYAVLSASAALPCVAIEPALVGRVARLVEAYPVLRWWVLTGECDA